MFDNPNPSLFNPKHQEQVRRDEDKTLPANHTHTEYMPTSAISMPWKQTLNCRTCKRAAVEAIGLHLLLYRQA